MQLAFDFDLELVTDEPDALPPWTGAPLEYHEDFYTYAEHLAAGERQRLEHGASGAFGNGMWHHCMWHSLEPMNGHDLGVLIAGADMKYQLVCDTCRWHAFFEEERALSEAANDHAWPGWRDLPVMPGGLSAAAALDWCAERYPKDWQAVGAPVLTARVRPGNRHVPGRSPYGGYDMAARVDA